MLLIAECNRPPPIFAILIGIDEYLNVTKLKAAVADAKRVRDYLKSIHVPDNQIEYLTNKDAKRSKIISAFRRWQRCGRIERDNNCILIYYAGHGGEIDAPESWKAGGSRVQMILPYDYDMPSNNGVVHGIPDRVIGQLLEDLAREKGNNIVRAAS